LPEGGTSSGFPTVAFASPVAADCAGRCCPKLANAARLVKDRKYSPGLHGHANACVDVADLLTTGGNSGHESGHFLQSILEPALLLWP